MSRTLTTQKLNILHAEDREDVFESCKKSIERAFEKGGMPIPMIENVVFCNSIFRRIMEFQRENKVFDILLLDLELLDKSEYNGINAIESIVEASPHTKIFVLSGKIYDRLYHEKLREYQKEGKIVGFYETAEHETWCSQLLRTVTARKVGILHFSDMHISQRDNSKQILSGFAENFQEEADLLIFSGDISNRGKAEEFEKARDLLRELCKNLGIRHSIYVPGNHDIVRDSPARSAFSNFLVFRRGMAEYEGDFEEPLTYPDVTEYADYLSTVKVYPELRTIICGLNSAACIIDENFGYSYGEVTTKQLEMAEKKLMELKTKYPNYLVVGTFHHNIFEAPYYFDYGKGNEKKWIPPVKKQGLILKTCFENEMNLLLVGHSHVSSSYSMVSHDYGNGMPLHVLSAGLFSEKGVTPLEPQLKVNYLSYQVDLGGNISNMYCQPYVQKLTDLNWRKMQGYYLALSPELSQSE